ncbi:MAG: MFS transporter [Myxococcota bacterium]|nr:MFS transporter [Myxococcota bacterium]
MATPLTAEQRKWRTRIFTTTWIAYFGFYFARTPFNATKADIGKEAGFSATTLGDIGAVYLIAYAVGQFLASGMGTKLGPRRNVLIGMTLSILVTLAMGITLSVPILMGLVLVNGLAQATGWSGNVGTMANWFHKEERGRVMGMWSTNFTVGSLASLWAMAGVLYLAARYGGDWRWCFYFGAFVLAIVWVQFYLLQRNRPEDVALAPIDDPTTAADESKSPEPVAGGPLPPSRIRLSRDAWINLLLVGGFYFFAKLIRYAVWGWAAYFLVNNYFLSTSQSALASTAFSLCGLPGVYVTGYLSDRYFGTRRAGVSTIMMIGMMIATGLLIIFSDSGVVVFVVLLGAVGFTLFGPDALLTGAGAIDIGGRKAATFAAGFISGLGSLGPIVQELVIGRLYDAKGGNLTPIFALLFGSAVMATVFCGILVLRNRSGGKGI